MDLVKRLIGYAVLIALLWAGATWLPRIATPRVVTPPTYTDIEGLKDFADFSFDPTVGLGQLEADEAVCFRLDRDPDKQFLLGWIAGLPGDVMAIASGVLTANGKAVHAHGAIPAPDAGPLVVPANHFYVVSSRHEYDSVRHGPLPVDALRGRLAGLP